MESYAGRRRVPRRAFESPVGLLAGGEYDIQSSLQVGEGGMLLGSNRPLKVGDSVLVNFFISSALMVIVRGAVRYQLKDRPHCFGLEFDKLEFNFKREIRNFVAAATRGESENNP